MTATDPSSTQERLDKLDELSAQLVQFQAENRAQAERDRRLVRLLTAVMLVLILVVGAVGVVAYQSREQADAIRDTQRVSTQRGKRIEALVADTHEATTILRCAVQVTADVATGKIKPDQPSQSAALTQCVKERNE